MSMAEKRKALLIGNDDYRYVSKLRGCRNDVKMMKEVLGKHGKGDPNFTVIDRYNLKNDLIKSEILKLLKRKAIYAVLYFSGHGRLYSNDGYICGVDSRRKENFGVSMEWLMNEINESNIPEITVILDCCHAGEIGNFPIHPTELSVLRKGVTILAATTKDDTATEFSGKGVFTSLLYDGLNGAAADILGHVTPVGLYNCAESILSPWEQRPVFKSFVDQMTPLRYCLPSVKKRITRKICDDPFFSSRDQVIKLSSSMLTEDSKGHHLLLTLMSFEKNGLLDCPNRQSLLEATLNEQHCQLSTYGKHVWDLVRKKRI